jgi:hypothetical protein
MTTIPTLKGLHCEHTTLVSFKGAVEQPALESLDFANTPLSRYEFHRLMAIIVFGSQLKNINGHHVVRRLLIRAAEHKIRLRDLLLEGWIVTSLQRPIVIYNPITHARRQIYCPDPSTKIGKVIEAWNGSSNSYAFERVRPKQTQIWDDSDSDESVKPVKQRKAVTPPRKRKVSPVRDQKVDHYDDDYDGDSDG